MYLLRQKGSVIPNVGISLIAAAVAGWVLFVWVMLNQEQARRLDTLIQLGFVDGFLARSTRIKDNYDTRLQRARQSIDILGFGLRQLREDYLSEFPAWVARATVRILLIDPDAPISTSSHASQRDKEEGNSQGTISKDVSDFLEQTTDLRSQHSDRFQVRLYTALPSINIFRVDDELFWGPYLVKNQSRNMPTLLVRRGGGLFDPLLAHFDSLWCDTNFSHEPRAITSP